MLAARWDAHVNDMGWADITTDIFFHVARVGIVADKVATWLHPVALQLASGGHEGVGTQQASCHYPASGTRLKPDHVPLEQAECQHQVGCWRPKPVKRKISIGTDAGQRLIEYTWRWPASGGPLEAYLAATLCHPVDEGSLASIGWLASGVVLEGCSCYACRDEIQRHVANDSPAHQLPAVLHAV